MKGLRTKYVITHADTGKPVSDGKFRFVINLDSEDDTHRRASVAAAEAYAHECRDKFPELSDDLMFEACRRKVVE